MAKYLGYESLFKKCLIVKRESFILGTEYNEKISVILLKKYFHKLIQNFILIDNYDA